jgi:hypothetical protein
MAYLYKYRTIGISYFLFVTRCSAWNGSRAFSKYLVRCILLVTSADESRRQIVVCPPVYAAGLDISPCGATCLRYERRRKQTTNHGLSAGLRCGVSYFPVWCYWYRVYLSIFNRRLYHPPNVPNGYVLETISIVFLSCTVRCMYRYVV